MARSRETRPFIVTKGMLGTVVYVNPNSFSLQLLLRSLTKQLRKDPGSCRANVGLAASTCDICPASCAILWLCRLLAWSCLVGQ